MTPQAFIENYQLNNLQIKNGSLCFWGHWFGKPQDSYSVSAVQFDAAENILIIIFSQKEKLSIFNPTEIEVYIDHLEIKSAHRVYLEWFDYGKPRTAKNLFYFDFVKTGEKIIGKNNIHWSVINAKELSVQKPAVLLTFINKGDNN